MGNLPFPEKGNIQGSIPPTNLNTQPLIKGARIIGLNPGSSAATVSMSMEYPASAFSFVLINSSLLYFRFAS